MQKRSSSVVVVLLAALGVVAACSEDPGSTVSRNLPAAAGARASGGSSSAAGSGGKTAASGSTTSASGSGGGTGSVTPSEACEGLPFEDRGDAGGGGEAPEEACNGVALEAEAVPVDVFIIMDRSQSMGELVEGSNQTRWEALHDAVQRFTEAPSAAEVRAGIGFFGWSGAGDDSRDCDPSTYAEPSVAIDFVSEVGPALVEAMDAVSPGGLTPTVPALQGSLRYARAWAADNPGRATSVVLVTDGFPTQCENGPERISEVARDAYESPEHIRTFVVGVGDVARFNLDNYARAGGTRRAYLTDAGDVTASFVEALNNITNRALACEYQLPPPPEGMKLDTEKVQVVYTPAAGDAEEVPRLASLGDCARAANGGWYYDDANQPSKMTVCPCTCARLQAGRVDVRLGCKPRLGLR